MAGSLRGDEPALGCLREGLARRRPTPLASLEVEAAEGHPARPWTQCHRAFRQAQRSIAIAGAQRLVQQAAQAEKLGLGPLEHRHEELFRRPLVAVELRRLGGKEQGQGRVRKQQVGSPGIALRLLRIAGRDRDHALGERPVAGAPTSLAPAPQYAARAADDQRQDREQQHRRQGGDDCGGNHHPDRGLHLPALPDDLDPARMIGEENGDRDHHRDDEEADNGADHGVLDVAGASAGAPPGASGGWPRRATSSSCRCANAASTASRCRAILNHGPAASALAPASRSSSATASARSPRASASSAALTARFRSALRRAVDPPDRHQGAQPGERLGSPIRPGCGRGRGGDAAGEFGQAVGEDGTAGHSLAGGFGERSGRRDEVGPVLRECAEGAQLCREGPRLLDRLAHLQKRHEQRRVGSLGAALRPQLALKRRKSIGKIGGACAEPG